jgi:hypothetical protein
VAPTSPSRSPDDDRFNPISYLAWLALLVAAILVAVAGVIYNAVSTPQNSQPQNPGIHVGGRR